MVVTLQKDLKHSLRDPLNEEEGKKESPFKIKEEREPTLHAGPRGRTGAPSLPGRRLAFLRGCFIAAHCVPSFSFGRAALRREEGFKAHFRNNEAL